MYTYSVTGDEENNDVSTLCQIANTPMHYTTLFASAKMSDNFQMKNWYNYPSLDQNI